MAKARLQMLYTQGLKCARRSFFSRSLDHSPGFVLISICIKFGVKFCTYYCVNKWWKKNISAHWQCL